MNKTFNLNINDLFDELKEENNRLLAQVLFQENCIKLLENYRNYFISFCNSCKCGLNFGNKLILKELEKDYKQIFDKNESNSQLIPDINCENSGEEVINSFGFNRRKNDNNLNIESNESTVDFIDSNEDIVINSLVVVKNEDNLMPNSTQTSDNQLIDNSINNSINEEFVFGSNLLNGSQNDESQVQRKTGKRKKLNGIKNQVISNETRKRIIENLINGETPKDLSKIFKVKVNTIWKMFKVFKKSGNFYKKNPGHRKQLLNSSQKAKIFQWIDSDCTLTLKQLVQMCLDEWGISLSSNTVERCLKTFHFSVKRKTLAQEIDNSVDAIQKRYEFAVIYNQLTQKQEKIYFLDQIGVQLWSRAKYRRSADSSHKRVKSVRTRHYSISSVLTEEEIFLFEINDKFYEPKHFEDLFNKLFEKLRFNGIERALLIIDGNRFAKTEPISDLIQSKGHYPIFLPPFSPFLNPFENLFNEWKDCIKQREPINEEDLHQIVLNSSELIKSAIEYNCFKDIKHYINRCLNREQM